MKKLGKEEILNLLCFRLQDLCPGKFFRADSTYKGDIFISNWREEYNNYYAICVVYHSQSIRWLWMSAGKHRNHVFSMEDWREIEISGMDVNKIVDRAAFNIVRNLNLLPSPLCLLTSPEIPS